ncbi:MAG: hypothetical protein COA79_25850 [Planctomycetota bacterium]|nr:MAG: hypothetical protein COA79_25850 [Planctomycetota bacterium]
MKIQEDKNIAEILETIRSWSLLWNTNDLLQQIIKSVVINLNADRGCIFLLDSDELLQKTSFAKDELNEDIVYSKKIAEQVLKEGKAIYALTEENSDHDNTYAYCTPLIANRGTLGVIYIELFNHQQNISNDDKMIFEMLGVQSASFLENALLYLSAITDPLTSLYSHRHFQQECDQLIRQSNRDGKELSLMIIDLDNFKQLNDNFGHEAGNKCLIRVSEILKEETRATDFIARFGGDEFEIILVKTDANAAKDIAAEIIKIIEKQDFPHKISATIGIACYPTNALDSQNLFIQADKALYIGKDNGKACVVISDYQAQQPKTEITNNLPEVSASTSESTYKSDENSIDGLKILSTIATTENSEVLLVHQKSLNRNIALKRHLNINATEDRVNAFKREASITATLSHPGIVPLYSMGVCKDARLYYTMRSLDGLSLEYILNKLSKNDKEFVKQYTQQKMLSILLKTIQTIAYTHHKRIAHLDIQPSNIIIGKYGDVTLIDWGHAIRLDNRNEFDQYQQNHISGRPYYKAPELVKNFIGINDKADVYSLGIILYEIIAAKKPFEEENDEKTIEAIINETPKRPEKISHLQKIAPLLSNLCYKAISKNPDDRIEIADFSIQLNKYLFQESYVNEHYFSNKGNDIKEVDWKVYKNGKWSLKENVWTSENEVENILFWNKTITGDLTFSCEAWSEIDNMELSLICFGNSIEDNFKSSDKHRVYGGYYFQFGAENNRFTKLSRNGSDIIATNDYVVKPNQKYHLTISYKDRWLYCFIDNNLVFKYKEFLPFKGYHVGFYTYGKGAHFKPLKIEFQNSGLTSPAIKLGDDHFTHKSYSPAINHYNSLVEEFSDRLEGLEAKLKMAICLIKTYKVTQAENLLKSLIGTILEPHALAELALLELPANSYEAKLKKGDYQKAFEYFNLIFKKFPESQAKFSIIPPLTHLSNNYYSNHLLMKSTFHDSILIKIKLFELGYKSLIPPSDSHISILANILELYIKSGQWGLALKTIKWNYKKYPEIFFIKSSLITVTYHILFAMKEDLFLTEYLQNIHPMFFSEEMIYPAALLGQMKSIKSIEQFCKFDNLKLNITKYNSEIYELLLGESPNTKELSKYSTEDQNRFLRTLFKSNKKSNYLEMLSTIENKNYLEYWYNCTTKDTSLSNEYQEEIDKLFCYLKATKHIFNFDFKKASDTLVELKTHPIKPRPCQENFIIICAFMNSLNLPTPMNKKRLEKIIQQYLTGSSLELANNLILRKPFQLKSNWPKRPTECYFDRIIYCIWLFEMKEIKLFEEIMRGIQNEKYGNIYFQPIVKKLWKKLETYKNKNS